MSKGLMIFAGAVLVASNLYANPLGQGIAIGMGLGLIINGAAQWVRGRNAERISTHG